MLQNDITTRKVAVYVNMKRFFYTNKLAERVLANSWLLSNNEVVNNFHIGNPVIDKIFFNFLGHNI